MLNVYGRWPPTFNNYSIIPSEQGDLILKNNTKILERKNMNLMCQKNVNRNVSGELKKTLFPVPERQFWVHWSIIPK